MIWIKSRFGLSPLFPLFVILQVAFFISDTIRGEDNSGLISSEIPGLAAPHHGAAPLPQFPVPTTPKQEQRLAWFREAKFGLFIHWGLYSVPAGEWHSKKDLGEWFMLATHMKAAEYAQFAPRFNPTKFDPKRWMELAKYAGMKYVVLTCKHHDGFCLWDTQETDFNVVKLVFDSSKS